MRSRSRVFFVAMALGLAARLAGAGPNDVEIDYRDDTMTARLQEAPLGQVLEEVARRTGAQLVGRPAEGRTVTATFERLPLPEALRRLLGDENFTLVYSRDGTPQTITLRGAAEATVRAPAPPRPDSAPAYDFQKLLAEHPPVPIHGALAKALGGDTATFRQLFEAFMREEDPAVRELALRTALQAIEAEPPLRDALVEALKKMPPAELARIARKLTGAQAEEFLQHVAAIATTSEVRQKALAARAVLPASGDSATAAARSPDPAAARALRSTLASHPPVEVEGALSEALGSESATFQELFQAAVRQEDAGVRTAATQRLMTAIEADPAVRDAIVKAVSTMPEAELVRIVRTTTGPRAEEFLTSVTATVREAALRQKASGVLRRLRETNAGS